MAHYYDDWYFDTRDLVKLRGVIGADLPKSRDFRLLDERPPADRIELLASRLENGLDLWTGEPSLEAARYFESLELVPRECSECGNRFMGQRRGGTVCFSGCNDLKVKREMKIWNAKHGRRRLVLADREQVLQEEFAEASASA